VAESKWAEIFFMEIITSHPASLTPRNYDKTN